MTYNVSDTLEKSESMSITDKNIKEIHRLLKNIVIPYERLEEYISASNDQMTIPERQQLIDYSSKHFPLQLFRYRAYTENAIKALENDELYLTRADYFNDPYDCLLYFDKAKLRKGIELKIRENIRSYLQQYYNVKIFHNFGFSNADEFIKHNLPKLDEFLDDVQRDFDKVAYSLQKDTYIACMSESITSPVMWAHYADNHQGFAIEYQFLPQFFTRIFILFLIIIIIGMGGVHYYLYYIQNLERMQQL